MRRSSAHQNPPTIVLQAPTDPGGARYLPKSKTRAAKFARSPFSIRAFVGANGGGKTLAIVEMCVLPSWEAGRLVVSNMTLYPERVGYSADLYKPLGSWREIVTMGRCMDAAQCPPGECVHSSTQGRGALLILDEASAALPSRQSGAVPPQLVRVLNQLRKRDVELVWSAPAYQRMDLAVRETTQAVTVCTGLLPDKYRRAVAPGDRRWFPPKAKDEDGQPILLERGWAPNRLFQWVTYEAMSYDEFTLGKTAQLRPKSKRSYWRTRHQAMHAYGTTEGVDLLDHLTDSGACMDCGLPRKRQNCSCGVSHGAPSPGAPAPKTVTADVPPVVLNRAGIPHLADSRR